MSNDDPGTFAAAGDAGASGVPSAPPIRIPSGVATFATKNQAGEDRPKSPSVGLGRTSLCPTASTNHATAPATTAAAAYFRCVRATLMPTRKATTQLANINGGFLQDEWPNHNRRNLS